MLLFMNVMLALIMLCGAFVLTVVIDSKVMLDGIHGRNGKEEDIKLLGC